MTNIENIKRKIAALLAKARSTENTHEADAFIAKAQEMLEVYQLEEWDLGATDDLTGVDVITNAYTRYYSLWGALARYYGAEMIRRKVRRNGKLKLEVDIVGRESSRVTTQLMFPFIMQQATAAGRKLKAEGHYGSAPALTYYVINALVFRIWKLVAEAEAHKSAKAQSRALVVVPELEAFIKDRYPNIKEGRASRLSSTSAARAEAEKVSLYRQTKGNEQLKLG